MPLFSSSWYFNKPLLPSSWYFNMPLLPPVGISTCPYSPPVGISTCPYTPPVGISTCPYPLFQMVFIPVNTTGQFYAVSCGPDEQDDLRMLYQVPQLLADYRLPLKVHLVQGTLPSPRPSGFSGEFLCIMPVSTVQFTRSGNSRNDHLQYIRPGSNHNFLVFGSIVYCESSALDHAATEVDNWTLMLEFYQEEDVILACTLPQDPTSRTSSPSHSSVQPRLLEMDADSKFLLSRPLFHQESESRLFKSPVLQVALCFCRDRGDHWRRQIKVTHHIFPSLQSNPSAKLTNPQKETKAEAAPVVTKMVSKERNETRNKISRPITKKSSSFTYTKVQSDVPVISGSGPPCELLRVTKTTAPTSPLERALSHEQIIKSPAICQQEKLQKHSIVISALTRESRQTRLPSVADIQNRDLPSILKPLGEEIPYGRVADDVGNVLARCNDDENIYAEICDCETNNTSRNNNKHKFRYLCLRSKNMDTRKEDFYYVQLEGGRERVHSNISPPTPSTQEPTYDTVC
uniref:CABIT domain-containing protein n=1 Tax=Timema genevievae TaxID=629358 RepID=A0A7R9PN95_TIMGE|nr:unnamed protein product [Timema genevievae]